MKKFLYFLAIATPLLFSLSLSKAQVNIIPIRTDVAGFATWTDTDVAGTTYLQLLKSTTSTITPAMNFDSYIGETLNFTARTYGGVNVSENTITVSISVDNGSSWTAIGTRTPPTSSLTAMTPYDLSAYNGTQVKVRFTVAGTSISIGAGIDDITITGYLPSAPTITVSPNSISSMNYVVGNGPSAEQYFTISGVNLTNNISLTAPTNYEFSLSSGSGFTNAITLTQSGGLVANTTIYVRLKAGLSVGTYNGQTINAVSTGATSQTVTCNGIVTNTTDPSVPTSLFEIQNILVDACAGSVEGQNEMVIFQVGPTDINVTDLRVDGAGATGTIEIGKWPNSTNLWLGISAPPSNPTDIAYINSTIVSCGKLIEPIGGILQAGKKILLITSTNFDPTAHSFATLQDTLYVIFQNAGNTAGHFVNYGTTSERTFVLRHVPSGYGDTIIYNRSYLVTQLGTPGAEDGGAVAYTWNGTPTYYNNGCQAPYIPMDPSWNFNSPSICETDAAINLNLLISGTTGGVWSGTGVSGNTFTPSGLSGSINVTYTLGIAPCDVSEMHSIIVNLNTTPLFAALGPYCVATSPASLPTTSTNSITGTWSPATINTASVGTIVYTFTPDAGQCALSTTMSVIINAANTIPTFTALGPFCLATAPASLPTTSTNSISGTWSPATISTASVGTTVYTFTPTAGQCAISTTMSITVSAASTTPSFTALGPYCMGAVPASLPTTSTNSITGTWSPATISTASVGTTVYTFTPAAGQCAVNTTMSVTINTNITPSFAALGPYCVGAVAGTLPTTSTNSITGTWSPATISTATAGTILYTFTPTAGQCATAATMSVVVSTNITPSFTALGPYCVGAVAGTLPTTSTNSITGTWSPATISTATAGTTVYTFTPTAGQCATTRTMSIVVNTNITPSFTALGPYCVGAVAGTLPTTSTNSITGTWSPSTISTATAGTTVYTFTPTAGQCATTRTMSVTINANTTPNFTALGPYCVGAIAGILPTTSTNSITGTWSPSTISTATAGTSVYTFTPTAGQCATTRTMSITINTNITPNFTALGPYCTGAVAGTLPTTSTNSITGTWSPATISTATVGTTVYTFTPTAGQCATTRTMSVVVASSFTPTFTALGPYCQGASAGTLATTSTNGITGTWSPSTISTATAGTTVYTFTPNAGQCAVASTMSILVNSTPSISAIGSNPNCFGNANGSVTVNIIGGNPVFNIAWNGGSANTLSNSYLISSLASGNYTITLTDVNNCIASGSANLTQPTALTISVVSTPIGIFGGTSNVTVSASGGTAPYSGTGIFNVSAGTYTYTVTDNNGCTASQTITITQPTELLISVSSTPINCYGELSQIIVSATGGVSPYSGTGTFNVTAGTYTYTITDNNGSTATSTVVVSQPSQIVLNESVIDAVCYGEYGTAAINVISGGVAPFTILWQNNSNQFVNNSIPANTNFAYTVTDFNSCPIIGSVLISQPEELLISYTTTDAGCFNSADGSIVLTSISGGIEPYNFIWNNGYPLPSLYNVSAGNYQVTVSDQNGCENFAQVELFQADEIFLSIIATDALCSGAAGKLTATVTGGISPYTYLWNNSATTSEITNLNPGTYSLTVTDANLCTISQTVNVNISGSLNPTIAITNPISCFSLSDGTLQANCPSAVLPNTYTWNNGITTAINQNLAAGTYSVILTDSRGCSGNATINLINPAEIRITSTITPISCNGESDAAITVIISGGSNPYSFIWNNSGTTATIENLNSGNYSVSVTDSRNCTANANFNIIQPNVLNLDYQIHEIMCYGFRDGSLLLSAAGGSTPYSFGLSQGTTEFAGNVHNSLSPGIYTIFVEDNNNCRISQDIVFQEPAPILAEVSYTNPSCIGINNGSIELEVTGGILPYLFSWNENITDIPIYASLTQGDYEINIIDANNCELSLGSVSLEDPDIDCIRIPNAFTPNADGVNDTWIIENIDWFADAYIQVFNRWGQEIYGARPSAGDWNGTFNNKFVPTGTYLYVVNLNNGMKTYTGTVSVVY